jgi:hypothetical protein
MKTVPNTIRLLSSALLLITSVAAAYAQPSDTITANPKAARLHRIWSLAGNPAGGGHVGQGCGGVGDLDGDGLSEFAVLSSGTWRVYRGKSPAPDTSAIWSLDSCTGEMPHPILGDFLGTGERWVGFAGDTCYTSQAGGTACLMRLRLFKQEGSRLSDTPVEILDPKMLAWAVKDIQAADLDGDGADELIVVYNYSTPEIWIYKGGPGFQVDSPTVIIHDPPATANPTVYHLATGDLDGDGHPDLVASSLFKHDSAALKFFWGSDSSFYRWQQPDRTITFFNSVMDVTYGHTLLDCDGDGIEDLFVDGCVFRSGSGKDARRRAYSISDADVLLRKAGYSRSRNGGYLNDTTHRYAMSIIACPTPERLELLAFGGGPDGPDRSYEAYYQPGWDGYAAGYFFGDLYPMGDCNGDGWGEFIIGNSAYGFNAGVALILGGGPDIPRDASLGVEAVAGEGYSDAVSIWPNPLGEELHIAWRGDLRRMPRRFVVYDMVGREVARGEAESWRGEALWHCAGVGSGAYVLTVYDEHGSLITSVRLVKAGQ